MLSEINNCTDSIWTLLTQQIPKTHIICSWLLVYVPLLTWRKFGPHCPIKQKYFKYMVSLSSPFRIRCLAWVQCIATDTIQTHVCIMSHPTQWGTGWKLCPRTQPPPPLLKFHNNAVGSYQSILIAQSFCPQIVFVTDHKVIPLKLEQKNRNWTVSSVYFKIFVHQLSEIPK